MYMQIIYPLYAPLADVCGAGGLERRLHMSHMSLMRLLLAFHIEWCMLCRYFIQMYPCFHYAVLFYRYLWFVFLCNRGWRDSTGRSIQFWQKRAPSPHGFFVHQHLVRICLSVTLPSSMVIYNRSYLPPSYARIWIGYQRNIHEGSVQQ